MNRKLGFFCWVFTTDCMSCAFLTSWRYPDQNIVRTNGQYHPSSLVMGPLLPLRASQCILYRVLVSVLVTLFCIGKATGLSRLYDCYTATANQLDRLVAVVLTTIYAGYRLGVSSYTHYLQILGPGSLQTKLVGGMASTLPC